MPEHPEVWVDHDRKPLKHKPEQCPRCESDMTLRHHCGTPIDADELIRRLEQSALLAFKAADCIDPDDGLHYRGKGCGIQWAIAIVQELANGGEGNA